MLEYNGVKIRWFGHDSFLFEKGVRVVADPYKIAGPLEADLVLVSHNHFDHMSIEDLQKVASDKTTIVAAQECIEKLGDVKCKEKKALLPGQEMSVNGVRLKGSQLTTSTR